MVGNIPWRGKWQPAPVFLPRGSRGEKSLAGYGTWGLRVRRGGAHTHALSTTFSHLPANPVTTDSLLLNSLHPIVGCADWFPRKHTSPLCHNLGGDATRVRITKQVRSRRGLVGAAGTGGGKCRERPAETEGQRHLMLAAGPVRLGPVQKLLQAQLPPHRLSPDSTE